MRVQDKVRVSGNGEGVDGERIQHLRRLDLARNRARSTNLGKAVGDVEDEDDEQPVGRSLDLKVAEKRVGAEEVERLVYYVCCGWIGCVEGFEARAIN